MDNKVNRGTWQWVEPRQGPQRLLAHVPDKGRHVSPEGQGSRREGTVQQGPDWELSGSPEPLVGSAVPLSCRGCGPSQALEPDSTAPGPSSAPDALQRPTAEPGAFT